MGCHSSKEVFPCVSPGETSGTMSKSSKKIVQEMWFELKPDLKNFGVSIFIRQVHRTLCLIFLFSLTVYIVYLNPADITFAIVRNLIS